MPSFTHKRLIDRIAHIDQIPAGRTEYATWIRAGEHLALLRDNANDDELIIYASGPYTFIHSAVVCADKLRPIDQKDLLGWSCNPFSSAASYVYGGGREDVWIEPGMRHQVRHVECLRLLFVAEGQGACDGAELRRWSVVRIQPGEETELLATSRLELVELAVRRVGELGDGGTLRKLST